MVFSIYPWTLQLVRPLSVSNYTEQMRDFLLLFFFLFDLQLNKICLFYFWLKNDEAAATPVSPQSCWFFPLLPNLFQTMHSEPRFPGKRWQPRPWGLYLQFILLTPSWSLLRGCPFSSLRTLQAGKARLAFRKQMESSRKGRMGLEESKKAPTEVSGRRWR